MTTKKEGCVARLLEERRISNTPNLRRNMHIAKQLICQPEAKYAKVWDIHSKHPVSYEDGRLFLNHYRTSYSLNGLGNFKPTKMYELGALPSRQRIEDATLCRFALETIQLRNKGWRPSLLAVSLDNYLTRYDLDTGQTLEQVYLSSCYKYRHLSWNNMGHSIVIKSIQMKSSLSNNQLSRAGQEIPNVLLAFALFDVYPLELIGVAEITRKIFGKDIVDAMITEGMLMIMHQNSLLKLYSWERLMEKSLKYTAPLGMPCTQLDGGIVGSRSAGLPLNIVISECQPVLFEVKCQDHNLVLGGIPWHYIICPPGKQGQFHVYSVESNSLAKNGKLRMDSLSLEPDKCFFHADDSGRLIHSGADEVRVLRIRPSEEKDGFSLREEFCIDTSKFHPRNELSFQSEVCVTSSGRRIKKSSLNRVDDSVHCDLESIQLVDYQDDLDLFVVTAVHQEEDVFRGTVYLFNNETGEILKKIELAEPWLEFYSHDLTFDVDKIVHTMVGPGRKFVCYVYQLELKRVEDIETRKSKRMSKQTFKRNKKVTVLTRQRRRRNARQEEILS